MLYFCTMKNICIILFLALLFGGCSENDVEPGQKLYDFYLYTSCGNPDLISQINFYKYDELLETKVLNEDGIVGFYAPSVIGVSEFEFTMEPIFIDSTYDGDTYFRFDLEYDERQYSSGRTGVVKPGGRMTIEGVTQ